MVIIMGPHFVRVSSIYPPVRSRSTKSFSFPFLFEGKLSQINAVLTPIWEVSLKGSVRLLPLTTNGVIQVASLCSWTALTAIRLKLLIKDFPENVHWVGRTFGGWDRPHVTECCALPKQKHKRNSHSISQLWDTTQVQIVKPYAPKSEIHTLISHNLPVIRYI